MSGERMQRLTSLFFLSGAVVDPERLDLTVTTARFECDHTGVYDHSDGTTTRLN